MLTGVNSIQLAEEATSFGDCASIGKPMDVMDLRRKVSRALEQFARRSQPPAPQS